jgi:hypothetical protein
LLCVEIGLQANTGVAVGVGVLLRQPAGDDLELRRRLRERDVGPKPAEHLVHGASSAWRRVRIDRQRQPDRGGHWKRKAGRHHADDSGRPAVGADLPADD